MFKATDESTHTAPDACRAGKMPRAFWSSFVLLGLLFAGDANATSYFVRTDGDDANCTGRSNATYPGSGSGQACAWKTLNKCASTLVPGDTCFVQPGIHYTPANVTESTSGDYADNVASGCSCTKGSPTMTCTTGAASFGAGDFVQCDSGYGFFFTEVAGVSGTTITLVEGYPGPNSTGDTADRLKPIRYIGANGTTPVANPIDVVITGFKDEPADFSAGEWVPNSTYPNVYQYDIGTTTDPVWRAPEAIREVAGTYAQAFATWDLEDAGWSPTGKNGLDSYYKFPTTENCPCNRGSILANVADVRGSYGVEGTTVYVQTYNSADPDTLQMQASSNSRSSGVLTFTSDNWIVSSMTVEASAETNGEKGNPGLGLFLSTGANQRIKVKNVRIHSQWKWLNANDAVDVLFDDFTVTNGAWSTGTNLSGVKFRNFVLRGGHGSGWSIDDWSGASASDPIVIDRFRLHRPFSDLGSLACGGADHWTCDVIPGAQNDDPYWGSHGLYLGSSAANRDLKNLLIQNCIIELTYDGLGFFAGGGDTSVKVRNCTFGIGDAEHILTGSTKDPGMNLEVYNTVFFRADGGLSSTRAMAIYDPSGGVPNSNNNAWYVQAANGVAVLSSMPWMRNAVTGTEISMSQSRSAYGQDTESIIVCNAGCTGFGVYNKTNPWSDFTDTSVSGGTNYTPVAGARVINAGLNTQCPETDYYGNPRNDGACDIGAVEYRGSTPDTTPPAPVSNFVAADAGTAIALTWVHSTSSDNLGALVRVREDRAPSGPTDGSEVCRQDGQASLPAVCHYSGINGRAYFFSAYSYDRAGNYGQGASTSGSQSGSNTAPPGQVPNFRRTDTTPGL